MKRSRLKIKVLQTTTLEPCFTKDININDKANWWVYDDMHGEGGWIDCSTNVFLNGTSIKGDLKEIPEVIEGLQDNYYLINGISFLVYQGYTLILEDGCLGFVSSLASLDYRQNRPRDNELMILKQVPRRYISEQIATVLQAEESYQFAREVTIYNRKIFLND